MFYVEGIVDAIELEVSGPKLKQFSIVPSSEFLITLPDGKKKILFADCYGKNDYKQNVACLIEPKKSKNDKDIIPFKVQIPIAPSLIEILIRAKYNRLPIRVCTGQVKDERSNAVQYPDVEDVIEIHFV